MHSSWECCRKWRGRNYIYNASDVQTAFDLYYEILLKLYDTVYPLKKINAQSASLRSLVAAESKAAEIKAAVACFESVCQLLTGIC